VGWRLLIAISLLKFLVYVPSPPCGMATPPGVCRAFAGSLVVLSPPCGMATGTVHFLRVDLRFRAHRVGWRLDHRQISSQLRSEPTVWDGDGLCSHSPIRTMFRAHRVGWRHSLLQGDTYFRFRAHRVGWRLLIRNSLSLAKFRAHRVGWRLSLKSLKAV
jgi:hypothetical protein